MKSRSRPWNSSTYESTFEFCGIGMSCSVEARACLTTEAVKQDLASTEHDIPIPQNSKVLSYVELFQGRLRDFIQDGLTRGTKYLPMIQSVFRAEGLPLDLAYIPLIESAFNPNALSR